MMLIITLKHQANDDAMAPHKAGHKAFILRHIENGTFITAGPTQEKRGGVILAPICREEAERYMQEDPYVTNGLSRYRITAFTPTCGSHIFQSYLESHN